MSDTNRIVTDGFSNAESGRLFRERWPGEPEMAEQYDRGEQCGGRSFFAPFNADWGLCCNRASRHRLETVFEHFTCPAFVNEGWGPHNFSDDPESHCRCGGVQSDENGGGA